MKQLKDVLHYYLPHGVICEVSDRGVKKAAKLCGIYDDGSAVFHDIVESHKGFDRIKPHLFPLSSLTEEDRLMMWHKYGVRVDDEGVCENNYGDEFGILHAPFNMIDELISKKIDLFGLIDSGQAIAVNKENNPYV